MASAVLMVDGHVVAGAHEERYSKLKMDVGLPVRAARFCLDFAGLKASDVDVVAVVGLKLDPRDHLTKRYATFSVDDYIRENREYWYPRLIEKRLDVDYFDVMGHDRIRRDHYWNIDRLNLKAPGDELAEVFNDVRLEAIEKHLDIPRAKVRFMPHYMCHHYHAYYSGTVRGDDVLVIHNEAIGDGYNAVVSRQTPRGLEMICGTDQTDLGRLYKWMTLLLAMKPHQHEFKVMGLAPYATNYEKAKAAKVFEPVFKLDRESMLIGYDQKPGDLFFHFQDKLAGCRFDGIAGALQDMLEKRLVEWVTLLLEKTGCTRICYAGGVAMNVKANKAIAEIPALKDLFVPLSPADETTPMGAAYMVTEQHFLAQGRNPDSAIPPLASVYVGAPVDQRGLAERLAGLKAEHGFEVTENPSVDSIARMLAEGTVVARCRGRSEYGQRSLGNRAILANPAAEGVVTRINNQIKFRDFWMPFCPSILAEDQHDYLVNDKNIQARYMTVSFDIRPDKRKCMAAAIHPADYTARPQLVSQSDNPEYHALITAFKARTGVASVLNTSFNLHGEPMVEDPGDALHTFMESDLDAVWVGDFLVRRKTDATP